tara:strand:- start:60 stop:302 length:243 start_codon:yes stop_codon:yes gene_type:complete
MKIKSPKNYKIFIDKISKVLEINKKKINLDLKLGRIKYFDSLKALEILALFENDFKKNINPSIINDNCTIKKLFNIYKKK